jgi:seryl-tRNA synthetase
VRRFSGSSRIRRKRRATQVELDNILAESNKLSKDIGELMKSQCQSGDFKRKTVINKEKSKKLAEQADALSRAY